MIKVTRAWIDSTGQFHQSREDACKAEFKRALRKRFSEHIFLPYDAEVIPIDVLVEDMFDLDKLFGEATREDTRVEYAEAAQ